MIQTSIIFIFLINIIVPVIFLLRVKNKNWLFITISTFIWSLYCLFDFYKAHNVDQSWIVDAHSTTLTVYYYIMPFFIWLLISLVQILSVVSKRLIVKRAG